MSNVSKAETREPLIRLSRRASITPRKAWTIRIVAVRASTMPVTWPPQSTSMRSHSSSSTSRSSPTHSTATPRFFCSFSSR